MMSKTVYNLLTVFLTLFVAGASYAQSTDAVNSIANKEGGDGTTWEKAILIATAEELAYFAQQVNSNLAIEYGDANTKIAPDGKDNEGGFKDYYFALSADIDLSAHYWTPIGNDLHLFYGNFDGRGHTIQGLKVKVETASGTYAYAGFFGYTDVGTIRNLGVILAKEGAMAGIHTMPHTCRS